MKSLVIPKRLGLDTYHISVLIVQCLLFSFICILEIISYEYKSDTIKNKP